MYLDNYCHKKCWSETKVWGCGYSVGVTCLSVEEEKKTSLLQAQLAVVACFFKDLSFWCKGKPQDTSCFSGSLFSKENNLAYFCSQFAHDTLDLAFFFFAVMFTYLYLIHWLCSELLLVLSCFNMKSVSILLGCETKLTAVLPTWVCLLDTRYHQLQTSSVMF